jgi:hypothetical protein
MFSLKIEEFILDNDRIEKRVGSDVVKSNKKYPKHKLNEGYSEK